MNTARWFTVTAACALGGCTGIFHADTKALQLYVLQPPQEVTITVDEHRPAAGAGAAAPAAAPVPSASLRIMRPLPGPGLNTDRIALLRPGNRLDYYADGRWSAPLPDVLADLELATFHDNVAWNAVADDRSSFNAEYLLQTSIDQFTADYASDTAAPTVRVALHCLLIRRSDGSLLGSFAVTQSIAAQENRMASVIQAFQQVADTAVIKVAEQSGELLRSAKSPGSP